MNIKNVFVCLWLSVMLIGWATAIPFFAGNTSVVDASFFVSISAVNRSLTIIANSLRVGDHLLERSHA